MNRFDLEDRLVNYATKVLLLTKLMSSDYASVHLAKQLIRSSTSVALNYGEAQSAESRSDFIHKMKVSLKELRESFVCLKIIKNAHLLTGNPLDEALSETNELICIFVKSTKTAQSNSSRP